MRKVKLLLLFLTCLGFLQLQAAGPEPGDDNGKIKGRVYDKQSNQPIEYATITIYNSTDSTLITGTITDDKGEFEIEKLDPGSYYATINFLGYKELIQSDLVLNKKTKSLNLGDIALEPDNQTLDEVVVVAEQNSVEYQIDKKVVTVGQQMASTAMTAVEVLENVPSITVDIEGNVLLRGSSGFTVLIDGKPTVLDPSDVLRTTPASTILSIEIITNPSSRYQPDGTGGILNIITKKNRNNGINGLVNLNGGTFGSFSADALINYRRKNTNYYISGDYGNRPFPGESYSERETTFDDITTLIVSEGKRKWERNSRGIRAGMDWDISPADLLSVGVRGGRFGMKGSSELDYTTTEMPANTTINEFSENNSGRGGDYVSLTSSYLHKFKAKKHELAIQFNYRYREWDEFSENLLKNGDEIITSGAQTTESGPTSRWDIQLDYTQPFGKDRMFESGIQFRTNSSIDDTELFLYDIDSESFVNQIDKGNSTNYDRNILAAYSIYKGSFKKLGYQAGLRGEYTLREIDPLKDVNTYTIDRWDIFPSAHLSYQLANENQVMASYSRRIDRPRGWYLEPFISWSDLFNVRRGNPALKPEYIDAMELAYLKKWENSQFSVETYYRIKHNKIERILSVYDETTLLTTFENVGKDYSLGVEAMYNFKPFKWWEVNIMGNAYDYRIEGQLNEVNFDNSSFNWSSRVNNTFKFAKKYRAQVDFNYNSPSIRAQGRSEGYYVFNVALRTDFFDKKLSAVLQARDLFATGERISISESENFYSYNSRRRFAPMVSLSLSYTINNYKQSRKRNNQGGDDGEF